MIRVKVGTIIRKATKHGYRVWVVESVLLGGIGQESLYEISPLDKTGNDNGNAFVPLEFIDNDSLVEVRNL